MYEIIALKDLCARQGGEYQQLCFANNHPGMVRESFEATELVRVESSLVYCGLAQDVHIFGHTFLHAKDGASIYHGQSFQNGLEISGFREYSALQIQARTDLFQQYIEDECIFIGGAWPSEPREAPNFGHFIFEYLMRLAVFDLAGVLKRDLPVVIYDNLPRRWLGFFALAGVAESRLVQIPIDRPPAFKKVWVSSCPNSRDSHGSHRMWPAAIHWLRARLLSNAGTSTPPKRVYLGRKNARWRRVQNEGAVVALLDRYAFQSVEMSEMTAAEQVQVIRNAEIIVVACGATSVMTQLAPEHCIVIHLAPQNIGEGLWGALGSAMVLRQVIERIDCQAVKSVQERNTTHGFNEIADFEVNLETLAAKVEKAQWWIDKRQTRSAVAL